MFIQALAVVLPLILPAAAAPYEYQSALKTSDNDCPAVHIIGVRGTLEAPGNGELQKVVDVLLERLPGSDNIAIDYPATGIEIGGVDEDGNPQLIYNFPAYRASVGLGASQFSNQVQSFSEACPDSAIVVMGYSQGAQVLGDSLCGVEGIVPVFEQRPPLDDAYTYNIKAILQLGDPRNVPGLPWHAGNGTRNIGRFPRQSFRGCGRYGDFWQSYCDEGDFFCDFGRSYQVHLEYVTKYLTDIVEFIVGEVKRDDVKQFAYAGSKHGKHRGL